MADRLTYARELYRVMKNNKDIGVDTQTLTIVITNIARLANRNDRPNIIGEIFREIHQDFAELHMKPDEEWFVANILYWRTRRDWKKMLALAAAMEKHLGFPTTFQKQMLMEAYMLQGKLDLARECYRSMKNYGLDPSYPIHNQYLRLVLSSGRGTATERSRIADRALRDLMDSAKQVGGVAVPVALLKTVVKHHIDSGFYREAVELIHYYRKQNLFLSQKPLVTDLEIFAEGRAGNWEAVEYLWEKFEGELRSALLVARPTSDRDQYEQAVARKYRKEFHRAILYKLRQVALKNGPACLIPFIEHLKLLRIELSTGMWNIVLRLMLVDENSILTAHGIAERSFVRGTVTRIKMSARRVACAKRGEKDPDTSAYVPSKFLEDPTIDMFVEQHTLAIQCLMTANACDESLALALFAERYPRLAKLHANRSKRNREKNDQ
jgi:pentatricopeptide repeat protein